MSPHVVNMKNTNFDLLQIFSKFVSHNWEPIFLRAYDATPSLIKMGVLIFVAVEIKLKVARLPVILKNHFYSCPTEPRKVLHALLKALA